MQYDFVGTWRDLQELEPISCSWNFGAVTFSSCTYSISVQLGLVTKLEDYELSNLKCIKIGI